MTSADAAPGQSRRIPYLPSRGDQSTAVSRLRAHHLNTYSEPHGKDILHGTATYNADALIRLVGWSGELTTERARDIRFILAQTSEWDRWASEAALEKQALA